MQLLMVIITYLILAGSSLITKKMGQILVSEDLKSGTPSVLSRDILAGFVVGHQNPPHNSVPLYISLNIEVSEVRFSLGLSIFQNSPSIITKKIQHV